MAWKEERHGSDKGYRSDKAYIGRSPNKFWRVWLLDGDAWKPTEMIFPTDKDARAWAEVAAAGG